MPTFTRAAALTDWLEDEYLSELLLRAIKPRPGRKLPANRVVQLEWGLAGTAEHKLQIYDARAEGVSTWTSVAPCAATGRRRRSIRRSSWCGDRAR